MRLGQGFGGVLLALLASTAGWGCDAQVGDRYTGDVSFEVHGHVITREGATQDLVPAFVFYTKGPDGPWGPTAKLEIMDGELEGVYPSDFRLRIAGPPPGSEEYGVAFGFIALVPRDRAFSFESPAEDHRWYPPDADGTWLEHRTYTSSAGAQLTRDYSCTRPPCEVIGHDGSDEREPDGSLNTLHACNLDTCYEARVDCSDHESCYREYTRCDVSKPGSEHGSVQKVCTKIAESGDSSARPMEEYVQTAANYFVIYSDRAEHPVPGIKPGYNLLRFTPADSEQAFLDYARCDFDAQREEREREHLEEGDVLLTLRFLDPVCPDYELIENPGTLLLDLNLTPGLGFR